MAKVTSLCEDALNDQTQVEEYLEVDLKAIDSFIRGLDGKRGNRALTVEDAQALSQQLRQILRWHEVNAQRTQRVLLLMLQLSLLVQQDRNLKIDDPENKEALGSWFELWEKTTSAWKQYTEESQ